MAATHPITLYIEVNSKTAIDKRIIINNVKKNSPPYKARQKICSRAVKVMVLLNSSFWRFRYENIKRMLSIKSPNI